MTAHPSLHAPGWAFADDADIGGPLALFLAARATAPRLLGLGEPMHGEETFLRLRNAAFRHLVEHAGYRSVTIESDCLAGLTVDTYVTGGTGRLDDVMRTGFSHGFGASDANRELVEWMRRHNRDREPPDRIRFHGFDAPVEMTGTASPGPPLTVLHTYLAATLDAARVPCTADTIARLVGDDARWTDTAALWDPARSIGAGSDAAALRLVADDLVAALHAESPRLIAATSPDAWWRAELHGRTAAGLLRYHAATADPSRARFSRLTRLRDAMMAGNLQTIVAREARRGPTMAFAHNSHLQRDLSTWKPAWPGEEDLAMEWWSAGAIAGVQLGDDYAFLATALGSAARHGLGVPAPDTLEGALCALPADRYVLEAGRLAGYVDGRTPRLRRRDDSSTDHGYFSLDPDSLAGADGVVFLREIPDDH